MHRSKNNLSSRVTLNLGFSMVELIVVMAILALLIAISLPAIGSARAAAKKMQCSNNLRNLALALTQFDVTHRRLPASGYYYDPPSGGGGAHHNWAVSILPYLDQSNLSHQWDVDKPITDPVNVPLTKSHIPVFVCPQDITRSKEKLGDLSYVVNGGFGFTYRNSAGIGDCPLSPTNGNLDLNGDGSTCAGTPADDEDRKRFKETGLFFLENWKEGGTVRHHAIADIKDGTSQTFLVTENARTGYDPTDPLACFANPNPYRSAFYIGSPCRFGRCDSGGVDYSLCNSGSSRINSGLWSAEGSSPVPNSFHEGGVFMGYADGHVKFLSEQIDGAIYAALASPQGMMLEGTPLSQVIVSEDSF